MKLTIAAFAATSTDAKRMSEYWESPLLEPAPEPQHPLPHTYVKAHALPKSWDWSDVNGTSYVTHSLNQHIPQYCGSCWAHGAMSALADRVKIARKAKGSDINFSIQQILNCGGEIAGSCHGGSAFGAYQFVHKQGFIPYDTCFPYMACSSENKEGICPHFDTSCPKSGFNTCRTCSTFLANGGVCNPIKIMPNATIAEYGQVVGADKMAAEIYARGPIACGINAGPILDYTGGVYTNSTAAKEVDHIISVTGWGTDHTGKEYWNVRNSWGQYWGELGYIRVAKGDNLLGLESGCSWATPKSYTETNFACYEDGTNCDRGVKTVTVTDPAAALPFKHQL